MARSDPEKPPVVSPLSAQLAPMRHLSRKFDFSAALTVALVLLAMIAFRRGRRTQFTAHLTRSLPLVIKNRPSRVANASQPLEIGLSSNLIPPRTVAEALAASCAGVLDDPDVGRPCPTIRRADTPPLLRPPARTSCTNGCTTDRDPCTPVPSSSHVPPLLHTRSSLGPSSSLCRLPSHR
ncbi:hypothetical protein K466DRAFT_607407 [Polyporus arcularius HHB13444]|uniref:Uncharacterized protein n=1 Tax=Polyporus arcularius HHB13444 TaxID=1314778 RepID=A0A5C3NLZ6_9APHY|nr:hypothetical protein K466DRAFT_607407 [Polyporus arcularius HHB13444]